MKNFYVKTKMSNKRKLFLIVILIIVAFFLLFQWFNSKVSPKLIYIAQKNLDKYVDEFTNDYKTYNVDIILFGHTHEKLYIEHDNKLFINPGSLGCSKKGTVDFAILEISNKILKNCIFKSLEYDKLNLIKDYNDKSVPDKEFLMQTFYKIN